MTTSEQARVDRTETRGHSLYPYLEVIEALGDPRDPKNFAMIRIVHRMADLCRAALPMRYPKPGEDTTWVEEYSFLIDGHGKGSEGCVHTPRPRPASPLPAWRYGSASLFMLGVVTGVCVLLLSLSVMDILASMGVL